MVSLFKLENAAVILAFSSSLILYSVLIVSWYSHVPCAIIKGIAIWTVRQAEVRSDVDAEIFKQPTLVSPVCVAWCRVLLLDIGSSSSYLHKPGHYYLLHLIEVSVLSLGPCRKMNGSLTSPSLVTTLNTMIRIGCLIFIKINMTLSSDCHPKTLKSLLVGLLGFMAYQPL